MPEFVKSGRVKKTLTSEMPKTWGRSDRFPVTLTKARDAAVTVVGRHLACERRKIYY